MSHSADRRAPEHFERRVVGHAKLLRRSCGTCVNFRGGICTLYQDMPVLASDICPQYERGRGAALIGLLWFAMWSIAALLIFLVSIL